MKWMIGAGIALMATAAAPAQTLWRNIEAGMTKEQVRSLYPVGRGGNASILFGGGTQVPIVVSEGCNAMANIMHGGNAVHTVELVGDMSSPKTCGVGVLAGLRAKYGEPTDAKDVAESTRQVGYLKLQTTAPHSTYTWLKDGVTITFTRDDQATGAKWIIQYTSGTATDTSVL